jgi:hypothetical protein
VALRQLRVRLIEAETVEGRGVLKDRLIATALLADAQGRTVIGDRLTRLAEQLETTDGELSLPALQSELLAAEAMLHEPGEP